MKNLICLVSLFGLTFSSLYAQFNWESTGGPFGSLKSQIFSNKDYAFIPENDFFYRTSDGIHWEALEHHVTARLAIYKDTLVNILFDKNTETGHLQFSTDNGLNWEVKEIPNHLDNLACDIVLCSHGLYFYNISTDELHHSGDLGDTWNLLPHPGISGNSFYAINNRLFLERSGFLARSDDHGGDWEIITPPLPSGQFISDVAALDSNILVSTFGIDEQLSAIWYSHNHGQSWAFYPLVTGNGYDIMEYVEDNIYVSSGEYLFRSDDFGVSWDTLQQTGPYVFPYLFTGFKGQFLCTTFDKGVYRWDENAQSLIESNDGLSKAYVYDLSLTKDRIWASCGNGVYAYSFQNEAWEPKIDLPDSPYPYEVISANDHGWVITGNYVQSTFHFSEDNGQSWSQISVPSGPIILWIEIVGNNIFALTDFEVLRSTDKGESWEYLFDEDYILYGPIWFKDAWYLSGANNLYRSQDDGMTWDLASSFPNIYVLGAYADELYAVTIESGTIKLYISSNAVDWIDAGEGFPQNYNIDILFKSKGIFYRDSDNYYAFNTNKPYYDIYTSPIDQISWSIMPQSTPMVRGANPYDCVFAENKIYMGGEGVYYTLVDNPYITSTNEGISNSNHIMKIAPNPVHENFTISLPSVLNQEEVSLNIYDINGRLIKSRSFLYSESLQINVNELPSGTYFIHARTEDYKFSSMFVK